MAATELIQLTINDKLYEFKNINSLTELLQQCELYREFSAIAINYQFIPKTAYTTTKITNGDIIDILIPMQGG